MLAALVLVGGVTAVVALNRDDETSGKGASVASPRSDVGGSDVARREYGSGGGDGALNGNDDGARGAGGPHGDRRNAGHGGRDWKPGERREAWERGFGDRGGLEGDGEKVAPFVDESTIAGAKERRLEKRREREEAADAAGTVAPSTVYQSDKGTQYETINQTEPTELKDLSGEEGTVSFWVQPAWDGTSQDDAQFISIGDGQVRVYKNVNYLRFEITGADGTKASLGMPINDWNAGDWHQVAVTWDGRQLQLGVDGEVKSQNPYNTQLNFDKPKLTVGTNEPSFRPIAPGALGGIVVRSRAMSGFALSRYYHSTRPPD